MEQTEPRGTEEAVALTKMIVPDDVISVFLNQPEEAESIRNLRLLAAAVLSTERKSYDNLSFSDAVICKLTTLLAEVGPHLANMAAIIVRHFATSIEQATLNGIAVAAERGGTVPPICLHIRDSRYCNLTSMSTGIFDLLNLKWVVGRNLGWISQAVPTTVITVRLDSVITKLLGLVSGTDGSSPDQT